MKYLSPLLLILSIPLLGQETYSIAETHNIYSKALGEDREIHIYKPQSFWGIDEEVENYPVTYVLDGESQFLNTVSTIDYMSAAPMGNDLMPRSIVVGITNTNRNRDLTPTKGIIALDSTSLQITGGGPRFLEFITEELIPYVDSIYDTSKHRTIIGHSMGGLIVFESLLEKSEYFTNYLAIDPFLEFNNESYFDLILHKLRNTTLNDKNLYVAVANSIPTHININDLDKDESQVVQITKSNLKFIDLGISEDWKINLKTKFYEDEDHFSVPFKATYDANKFFYSYYPYKEILNYYHPSYADSIHLVKRLKSNYKTSSHHLGYEAKPLESYLNSWAYGSAMFDRYQLAIDLFDYKIELYPRRASVYSSKAYFLMNHDHAKEAINLFQKSQELEYNEDIARLLLELKDTK